MRRLILLFSLTLLSAVPASAQQLTVAGQPYQGPTAGSGADLMVGLRQLAPMLRLLVMPSNGGFDVFTGYSPEAFADPAAGEVIMDGQRVPCRFTAEGPLVNLQAFCVAGGLRYVVNPELNTIEVSRSTRAATTSVPGERPRNPKDL